MPCCIFDRYHHREFLKNCIILALSLSGFGSVAYVFYATIGLSRHRLYPAGCTFLSVTSPVSNAMHSCVAEWTKRFFISILPILCGVNTRDMGTPYYELASITFEIFGHTNVEPRDAVLNRIPPLLIIRALHQMDHTFNLSTVCSASLVEISRTGFEWRYIARIYMGKFGQQPSQDAGNRLNAGF